jgi:hypothetical protein
MTAAQVRKHYSDAKIARDEKRYLVDQRKSRRASRAYNRAERRFAKANLEGYFPELEIVTDPISEAVASQLEDKSWAEFEGEREVAYLNEMAAYHLKNYHRALAQIEKLGGTVEL